LRVALPECCGKADGIASRSANGSRRGFGTGSRAASQIVLDSTVRTPRRLRSPGSRRGGHGVGGRRLGSQVPQHITSSGQHRRRLGEPRPGSDHLVWRWTPRSSSRLSASRGASPPSKRKSRTSSSTSSRKPIPRSSPAWLPRCLTPCPLPTANGAASRRTCGRDASRSWNPVVDHGSHTSLSSLIPTLPAFQARVVSERHGVLNVSAHDPEAEG
jgi:hypothetical protein